MRLLTVATDPKDSFAVGTESIKIWKVTVNNEPLEILSLMTLLPQLDCVPLGKIAKPDGKRAT